jgi:hypothetical protein
MKLRVGRGEYGGWGVYFRSPPIRHLQVRIMFGTCYPNSVTLIRWPA